MKEIGSHLLSRLLDEHGAALVLYAEQWCNIPEDVVQEAFMKLMRQKSPPQNVVGWLYRVVRNQAIDFSRAESRRANHESERVARPWFVISYGDSLDAQAATEKLTSLPIEQREIIVLRIWGRHTFEQIAELVGTSVSGAHRHYETGLRALRKSLLTLSRNRGDMQS